MVVEDKGSAEKGGSTKSTDLQQSTVKPDESTVKPDESTVKPDEGTDKQDEGTDRQVEGTVENKDQDSRESATPTTTSTPTPTVFGDDETIAQVLATMSQNKIDPKAKSKGKIEEEDESDTESGDINEAEKKFKMLTNDEEVARKVQEESEADRKRKGDFLLNKDLRLSETNFVQELS
ncbi:hypothetical protein Tco_0181837 [Tanacetum coccineum]